MTAPTLVFAWGNPSRGDDALGPLFAERLEALAAAHPAWGEIEILTDFQLQVEHALDLHGRRRVLFVDASVDAPAPYSISDIGPEKDASFTTHAMTPQAVLQVYRELEDETPPPARLLAIHGVSFELGEAPTGEAQRHLDAALEWAVAWLSAAIK